MSKQEELLRDYRPPVHVAPLDPELKRKVRREEEQTGRYKALRRRLRVGGGFVVLCSFRLPGVSIVDREACTYMYVHLGPPSYIWEARVAHALLSSATAQARLLSGLVFEQSTVATIPVCEPGDRGRS